MPYRMDELSDLMHRRGKWALLRKTSKKSDPSAESRIAPLPSDPPVFDWRKAPDPKFSGRTLSGYAALFGKESVPLGLAGERRREIITPGAFSRSLRMTQAGPKHVWFGLDHKRPKSGSPSEAVRSVVVEDGQARRVEEFSYGSTTEKNLWLSEDGRGLHFVLLLKRGDAADLLFELAQAGRFNGCSFLYQPEFTVAGVDRRRGVDVLETIHLTEVSLIPETFDGGGAAYPDTKPTVQLARWSHRHRQ